MTLLKQTVVSERQSILVFTFALLFQYLVSQTFDFTTVQLKYEVFAKQYIEGIINNERLIDCSPLYFYFHVAVTKFLNIHDFVNIFQCFLQAVSAVLLFKLIRLRFSPMIAFICAVVFITNRSIIIYTNLSEPEPFMVFFLLAYLLFAMKQTTGAALISGFFLSCSLLTRSNFLPLVVLTPLFFWISTENREIRIRKVLTFLVPVAIAIIALTYRNSVITGTFTPFSMNPGYVFFEGNNPNSNGDSAVYPPVLFAMVPDIKDRTPDNPHVLYREFARRLAKTSLNITEVNAYWAEKGRNFLFDHPYYCLKTWLFKIYASFNNYRKHDLPVAYTYDKVLQRSYIPTIPFAVIGAMALAGLVISLLTWKDYLLFYGALGSQMMIMTLTYVSDRQRTVIIGVLIVFASVALNRLLQKNRGSLLVLLAVSLLTICFWYRPDLLSDDQYFWDKNQKMAHLQKAAVQARNRGRLVEAANMNALCLALTPWKNETLRLAGLSYLSSSFEAIALQQARKLPGESASSRFDLAIILMYAGLLEEAETIFKELVLSGCSFNRQHYQSSLPHYYLAQISELRHRNEEALKWLRKGLDRNPGDPWILSHLAVLTGDMQYRATIIRYFEEIDAEYFMGKAFFMTDKFDDAIRSFEFVLEKLPEFRNARIHLCLALAKAGRYEEATKHYRSAITARPDEIFAENQIIPIFREWARSSPKPEARYFLGVILQDFGHYREALEVQKDVLQKGVSSAIGKSSADRIKWLEKNALPQSL